MDDTQLSGHKYMHNAFWHENQVSITFQLGTDIPTAPKVLQEDASASERGPIHSFPPTFDKTAAINAMKLGVLSQFLTGQFTLSSYNVSDTLQPERSSISDLQETQEGLNSPIGKYLFTSKDELGRYVPTVISFFNFTEVKQIQPAVASSSTEEASMPEMTPSSTPVPQQETKKANDDDDEPEDRDKDDQQGNGESSPKGPVPGLVTLINNNLRELRAQGVPIVAASPVWLSGSTNGPEGQRGVGCPLTPPIPVSSGESCSSSPGLWPITLPELPSDLRRMTGDGVTVFILDTLPKPEEIQRAAEAAEENNLLLLDVANNVAFHYNHLPRIVDMPNVKQPVTGKDIQGRLIGFRMPDHGLFIAGIVRDIAPNANVECVRVLNDFCVGNLSTITKALEGIQNRMLLNNPDDNFKPGDLLHRSVVVNMSLVIPPDNEVLSHGFEKSDLTDIRKGLLHAIQALVNFGVVFVASAGNEGDLRYEPMNPQHIRPNALYPAAYAYNGLEPAQMMVPVGAVDSNGNAASYSCYPGIYGVAAYGGEVPVPFKQDPSDCFTQATDIDAVIGIYSSLSYPALSIDDCEATYPTPNANAWAYWVGTSFATPIISGVAARILELRMRSAPLPALNVPPHLPVPPVIVNSVASRQVTWTRLEPGSNSEEGRLIWAVQQCQSPVPGEAGQEQAEIEIVSVLVDGDGDGQ